MRREFLEALKPLCPLCRRQGTLSPLSLTAIDREEEGHILEGMLGCPQATCLREYPILDGLPMLIADLRQAVGDQLEDLLLRSDLGERLESVLGDCCGPDSNFEKRRSQLSLWGHDHWSDGTRGGETSENPPSIVGLMERALGLVEDSAAQLPNGPILDVGCAAGRSTFELAERLGRPALGVDLGFAILGLATGILRRGRASYPLRRVGLVYDRQDVQTTQASSPAVDFWLADALDLPFGVGFAMVTAFDLIDHVQAPRQALASLASCLAPGGLLILASSYQWTRSDTPIEGWLGGHSQRSPEAGRSEDHVKAVLEAGHPAGVPGLEIVGEVASVPRSLRHHDRSSRQERLHLLVARAPS